MVVILILVYLMQLRRSTTLNQISSFDGTGDSTNDDQGIGVEHDFEDLDIFGDYLGESNNSIVEEENPVLSQKVS